ncbi:Purple acid phosphatase 23 [Asimina triloba]
MVGAQIPTTLDGPFTPVSRRFDPSLREGSDDLPMDHPRLRKKVESIFPEQIALAISSSTSMWVSWVTVPALQVSCYKDGGILYSGFTFDDHRFCVNRLEGEFCCVGDAKVGSKVTAMDPSTVASEVWYGKERGKYPFLQRGSSLIYNQSYPFKGLLNYTSGIIHHVRLKGLEAGTRYYYKCGDSSLPAMSDEHVFETLPLPSAKAYPRRIAVVGDLGLTSNTTTTVDHLIENDPSMVLMVGDMSYANQYRTSGGKGVPCYSCAFPDAPIRETYQPRWDGWGRFMEPLISRVPMMVIEGNHEIEPQVDEITFKSYLSRFAVPSKESGSSSNLYYSFDAAGVHFIINVTPWLVAAWHPPWYNSYSSHYQEFECMRQEMEAILYQYGVDMVFSGHVHAYERMNRVYNYTLDPCGPVYITVGDGGNIEKVDTEFADDPGKCPSSTDNRPEFGGVCHINFTSGPAKGKFCWDKQPEWSAYRESSFGHGILEVSANSVSHVTSSKKALSVETCIPLHFQLQVINSTYALWTWHRNQDTYKDLSHGDQIYIVRQPEQCTSNITAVTATTNRYLQWGYGDIPSDDNAYGLFFIWQLKDVHFPSQKWRSKKQKGD